MPNTILVATDLSQRSEIALRRAFQLADFHNADLTVLHVVDDDLPRRMADTMRAEAENELSKQCDAISQLDVTIRVTTGDPIATVKDEMERLGADLLIVGVHRSRPLMDLITSTSTERLVRSSLCPVLIVAGSIDGKYSQLLVGVDLSPSCASAVRFANRLAPDASIATFHGVHIPYRRPGRVATSEAEEEPFLREAQQALDTWWAGANIPEGIEPPKAESGGRGVLLAQKLAQVKPDLLVIGAHGRAHIAPTLLGGFTREIICDPPCDVLVVRR